VHVFDVNVANHGSIVIVMALTPKAEDWVTRYVPDRMMWAGGFVVEPRYLPDLLHGMQEDGLTIEF
jgi:hypothetical protein